MKIVMGIFIAVIIALVVGFVPIKEVPYTETVQYLDTETYYAKEPLNYEAQSYVKKEDARALRGAILSTVAFSKDTGAISEALKWAYSFPEFYPIGYVRVRNTDKIQGTFKVEIAFHSGDKEYTEQFPLELKPGQVEEVKKSANIHYDKDKWSWEYKVTPSTKTVEKKRVVWKERPETRYKKVPIFEYLLSKF